MFRIQNRIGNVSEYTDFALEENEMLFQHTSLLAWPIFNFAFSLQNQTEETTYITFMKNGHLLKLVF